MKKKWTALLLMAGLITGMLASPICASETATEAEAQVEVLSENTQQDAEVTVAQEDGQDTASEGAVYEAYYEELKQRAATYITDLSAMTDEQLDEVITNGLTPDGTNSKTIAYNWRAIKKELGSVVEITEQTVSEEGSVVTVENKVVYDLPSENTDVLVTYTADFNKLDNTKTDKIYETLTWDIRYPFSKLIAEAGLNTFLGLGTVFVVLIFLSFVISRMKLLANIGTKAAPAAAAPASTAASAAPPVIEEEEEAVDDTELIAVIAAAIAASENTSTDGFVVRSIKKVNRRNRQRG